MSKDIQIGFLAALIQRPVPIKDVSQVQFIPSRQSAEKSCKDISNCELWVHAAAAYDETDVVHNAAAALGALHLAREWLPEHSRAALKWFPLIALEGSYSSGSRDLTRSSSHYGEAVRILSQNLTDKQRCYDQGNLVAVLLLYFFEVRTPSV